MAQKHRRNAVRIATVQDVKLYVQAKYVKVTVERSTMSEATELGVLRVCQLVLLAGQQTGVCSLIARSANLFT